MGRSASLPNWHIETHVRSTSINSYLAQGVNLVADIDSQSVGQHAS